MVAALALDLSTLLEICTPLLGPQYFLPCASVANVGKNIGWLAASASRAAINQSLSAGGSYSSSSGSNLGDVTAKSGSQAIVASLVGTALGIFFSKTLYADHGTVGVMSGFIVLSAVHQVATYKALMAVPLRSLDRHRLHIVLSEFSRTSSVPSPSQVATKEKFFPLITPDHSCNWLFVGSPLLEICPKGISELQGLILWRDDAMQHEQYILKVGPASIQLTFLDDANEVDLLRGQLHAYLAHNRMKTDLAYDEDAVRLDTHRSMDSQFGEFQEMLLEKGWQIGPGFVSIECGSSHRLKIDTCRASL